MPMLTTLRIGRPGVALPLAAANALRERRHAFQHPMDARHDILAVDDDRRPFRRPQRDVQRGAVLGAVDLLAAEHRVDARGKVGLFREREQQAHRLVGDPLLRVVEVDAGGLGRQRSPRAGSAAKSSRSVRPSHLPLVRARSCHALRAAAGIPAAVIFAPSIAALSSCVRGARRVGRRGLPCAFRFASHSRKPPTNALALSPTPAAGGQLADLLRIAAAHHDFVGQKRRAQKLDHLVHVPPPSSSCRGARSRAGRRSPRRSPCDKADARAPSARRCRLKIIAVPRPVPSPRNSILPPW